VWVQRCIFKDYKIIHSSPSFSAMKTGLQDCMPVG
jgi:hypothetical protein